MAFPDVRITIFDHTAQNVQVLDCAQTDLNRGSVKYEALPTGCGAATIELGLLMEEVVNRGYWTATRNIVEISSGDSTLLAPISPGVGAGYVPAPSAGQWSFSGTIPVTPNTTTTITFTLNSSAVNPTNGNPALYVSSGGTSFLAQALPTTTNGDTPMSFTFTPTTSTVFVQFAGGGTLWNSGAYAIKNVAITQGSTTTYILAGNLSQQLLTGNQGSPASLAMTTAGTGKLYLDSGAPFDTTRGEEAQQAYLWDGSALCMRIPVTLASDAGGPYLLTNGTALAGGGNVTAIPAYGVGTIVGRRRYAGYIMRVDTANDKSPATTVTLAGIGQRLGEAIGTFPFNAADVGTAIASVIGQFASRWPELNAGVYPTTGFTYTGSKDRVTVASMITELFSAINNGDQWVVRVGHDRTPTLMQIFVSATNTYTYSVTLPQGVTAFEPVSFTQAGADGTQLYNSVEVIGDTNSTTNQPASAIVQDTLSIALYGQIDAAPVTNTACKTDAACASYAKALLLQQSIPTAANACRVYTRNDAAVSGGPGGLQSRGDVVRGVSNVVVSRFDGTGSSSNEVPDSELRYTTGSGALWTAQNGIGITPVGGSNAWMASQTHSQAYSAPIDVVPGQTWTLDVNIDATSCTSTTSGPPQVLLVTLQPFAVVPGTYATSTLGQAGNYKATFTIPPGVTQVAFFIDTNGANGTPTWSHPNMTRGGYQKPYAPNYAFSNVYGLVTSVTTFIDAIAGDSYQDLKFAAVQPDANVALKAQQNTLATALAKNTQTKAKTDQYCVSSNAFGYTTSGLTVTTPLFLAIFASGSAATTVGNNSFTLTANQTNWAWLNPGNTWTVNTGPTNVPGAILYGIFNASSSGIIGFVPRAATSLVQVGVGNVNVAANLPAPTWSSATAVNGSSLNGLAADVLATIALTNVPASSAYGVMFYVKRSGQAASQYLPYVGENLAGLPTPSASQTVVANYGLLDKGGTYDFGVGYVGLAGFGPVVDFATGFVAQTIAIGAPYLLGGIAVTPAVTSPNATSSATANGISAAVTLNFTLTNQPPDTSLLRVNVWVRVAGAGGSNTLGGTGFAWSPYSGQPAIGAGTTSPPVSGAYTFVIADLTNGTSYDFGVSYQNVQNGESTIAVVAAGFAAAAVNVSPSQTSFGNTLTASFFGLTVDATGELRMPSGADKIYPCTVAQTIGTGVTVKYRFQLTSTSTHPGIGIFTDSGVGGTTWANGYLLQWYTTSGVAHIEIVKRTSGNFTSLVDASAAVTASALNVGNPTVPAQDLAWHELKITAYVDPNFFGRAAVVLGMYLDGVFFGIGVDPTSGTTYQSGTCGPTNRDFDSPTLVDVNSLAIVTGSATYAENAGTTTTRVIAPIERQAGAALAGVAVDTNPLVSGVVSGRHLLGASSTDAGAVADTTGRVLLTRHAQAVQVDATGSQYNMLPDGELQFGTAYWQVTAGSVGSTSISTTSGPGGTGLLGAIVIIGSGANGSATDGPFQLAGGVTYTLSLLYQDQTGSTTYGGNAAAYITDAANFANQVGFALPNGTSASGGRLTFTFTMPSSTSSVILSVQNNGSTFNGSGARTISQIQIEAGSVATGFKRGAMQAGTTAAIAYGAHHAAVTSTITQTAGTDGSYLKAATVYPRHLTSSAVTNAALAPSAVTSTNLAPSAVATAAIAPGAVTNPKIGSGAVLDAQIGTLVGSAFLNNQLSLNAFTDATPTLSSSTNSSNAATITVTASSSYNLRRTDGSTVTILGSNTTLSGFSGATTYYVYVWYNLTQNTSYTNVGVTNGYLMFAVFTTLQGGAIAQLMNKDGGVPVLIGGQITTAAAPASGTSSGTGSGGYVPQCPAAWQEVETLERGFVRADALAIGEHLRDPEDGWNEIVLLEHSRDTIVDVLAGHEMLSVEIGHLWLRAGGDPDGASSDWIATKDLSLDTLVSGRVDGAEVAVQIRAIKSRGPGGYMRIVCDRNRFLLGKLVAHNVATR